MKKHTKNEDRISAKSVHITIHKLSNKSIDYWLEKARSFRSNVTAVLVGLEENHEENKGFHAHIVIQFTTKQKLARKQFVDHFGSDSLHIATKPNKDALLMALGYVSKTGTIKQWGDFTYRGSILDSDPEVYRFHYQVKTKLDAVRYFKKVIDENVKLNKNVVKELAKKRNAIGDYLVSNPALTNSLHKLAYTWHLEALNASKVGFRLHPWVDNPKELQRRYKAYLEAFPRLFAQHKPQDSKLVLEKDYAAHADHDLEVLRLSINRLKEALQHGPHRPHKSLNLYIWSKAPSFGKTRLLRFLDNHMMAYRLPDDQWYVDYENGIYQVLVSDEAANFIKTKDYSHLKHIFEGEKVEFNLKGREKILKEDNPLIVLAENISFQELMNRYHKKSYDPQVMATRVLDLELRSRATLHFFIDYCFEESTGKPLE